MAGGGLPTGTLTFLFTALEGATHLLQRLRGPYPGLPAARFCPAAQGGRVRFPGATGPIADPGRGPDDRSSAALGRPRLKDLDEPIALTQVVHPGLEREFPRLRLDAVPGNLPKQVTRF